MGEPIIPSNNNLLPQILALSVLLPCYYPSGFKIIVTNRNNLKIKGNLLSNGKLLCDNQPALLLLF